MSFRRGFKSEANATSLETRRELGLGYLDRLDPIRLANHLEIPVLPLSSFVEVAPLAVRHLQVIEPEAFSAVTVFDGIHRTIVHNDAHLPQRQASNITHELSHGLLMHRPTPAISDTGCRLWNQSVEDEATWLAGALLVTEDAALHIARGAMTVAEAEATLGVSAKLVRYRLNVTGAATRVARASRFRVI